MSNERAESFRKFDIANRITIILFGVVGTIMMGTTGWTINKLWEFEKRITSIESNRFTSKDANNIMTTIVDLQKQVAEIPKEVPPEWFKNKVSEIEKRVHDLEFNKNYIRRNR